MTGVALVCSDTLATRDLVVQSEVVLTAMSESELRAYVATGEPLDKAGGYAYQGEARRLVERIEGSESNVIGLPMQETLDLLRRASAGGETR